MADEPLAILGLSTGVLDEALIVHRVVVRATDGEVSLTVTPAWRATRKDEARSLADLVDALSNALDRKRSEAPDGLAIKRVETPVRGKPSKSYDKRTRAEAAAMVAASHQGSRYFGYRTNEIKPRGKSLRTSVEQLGDYPDDPDLRDAINAACAALSELGA
jgi:hypothetical protein